MPRFLSRPTLYLLAISVLFIAIGASGLRSRTTHAANAAPESRPTSTSALADATPPSDSTDALRFNTLGVAYMNQQKFADAQKYFEKSLSADPKFSIARVNLGVSLLSQQKLDPARAALEQAAKELPNDPYAWYNLGLLYKDSSEIEKGIAAFTHVTQLTPEADGYYFVGYLQSQAQHYDEAIAAFQKALEAFPFHASAEFGIARAYQRKGDAAAAREHLARFQKITTDHLGSPFGAGYGDQGRYSLAELPRNTLTSAPAPIKVTFSVPGFIGATLGAAMPPHSAGVCVIDYDGDGRPDLFYVGASADSISVLQHNLGQNWENVTKTAGLDNLKGPGLGCAVGDYDNDTRPDLAVCLADGVHLFHNKDGKSFEDVTQSVGIRREPGCVGLTFVDYDHDGDLDLYVTMQPTSARTAQEAAHNVMWRNNGNSTFTDVSAETALGFDATGAGVVTTDFNNDRAVDFVIAGGKDGASILLNPREGKFTQLAAAIDFKKENLPPAVGVVALDFNKDGWMDLAFTHAGAPGISLWRNVDGKRLERVKLPDLNWQHGWGISPIDYDNDGWVDLIAVGENASGGGEVRLLRNLGLDAKGASAWADVSQDTQLDKIKLTQPRAIIVADFEGNGNPDLMITQLGGAPLRVVSDGPNQHSWMRIDLKGLNDNKSAIGTKVEMYAGALYQKWEVPGASGYLGQNAPAILAGLENEKSAEVVRLLWPTGVPQDEINLPAKKDQSIAELDRRGSSCPVLFAWNGHEYEFIADMIGPGVVGHWVAPNERDVPDPDEYLKVSARSLKPAKNRLLSFRFMEPMEETVYLDQVRLLAIDHPAGYDVFPNERFASNPPFPEFKVIATSANTSHAPLGAWDDKGRDVLPLLAKHDRKYVTQFDELPFAGFANLHYVELDLGPIDVNKPLRLILNGYTDYFTATSMYSADQAGIKVIAPYVEAQDAQGTWKKVIDDMGFPAGLARTMVTDLTGKLPPGTRRIRIINNLKIYWDSILIDQTPDAQDARVAEVPLADATLAYLGYPREIRLTPASDTKYSWSQRSMTGPYAHAAGNYTRYGNVFDLLKKSDDRFVVFSSGEGMALDFDPAKLPPLPAGWTRDYFFYADGFEKDLDFYAAHAFTVEPLPHHGPISYPYPPNQSYPADATHQQYQLDYNTRSRSDQMPSTLRYTYAPK
jgi:Tfp pilus assembly protein PilF